MMRASDGWLAGCLGALLAWGGAAADEPVAQLQFVVDGLVLPSNFTTHDGRVYVLEQYSGRVLVVENGELRPEPFLNLEALLHPEAGPDEGLLGIAFPPGEPEVVYLAYVDHERDLVVARFALAADGATAIASSAEVLFEGPRAGLGSPCGHIAFDPAAIPQTPAALYLCFGDDRANDAFSITAALDAHTTPLEMDAWPGKILRLEVAEPGRAPEVVALGLHNPWRFAFDPAGSGLIVPDVGRYNWEEVNLVAFDTPGVPNFGWPLVDGLECVGSCGGLDLEEPVFAYTQSRERCGIVGGAVYAGTQAPAWRGVFVFADRCSGEIFALRDLGGHPSFRRLATGTLMPSALGEGPGGEIWLTDQAGGALYRLYLPADARAGWRPVEQVMFADLSDALRRGFTRSQTALQRVVTSRSWKLGHRLGEVYRWLRAFWIF
jgi:glucose/arabinose dehydrogenase